MTFSELERAFAFAKARYDLDGVAACILGAYDWQGGETDRDVAWKFFLEYGDYIIPCAFSALSRGDTALAWEYLRIYGPLQYDAFPFLLFLPAMTAYHEQDWKTASNYLERYLTAFPQDEVAAFYLGNAYAGLGNTEQALGLYQRAIGLRSSFWEAACNHKVLSGEDGELLFFPSKSLVTVDPEDTEASFALPIFINARDRLGCLRQLVEWLLAAGYENIYILDNRSTYPPLLEYYRTLVDPVKVLRLPENLGYQALWCSNILEELEIHTPYVYTDPDVLPIGDCPPNVVQCLLRILVKYPLIKKVGLGLVTEDITFFDSEDIKQKEHGFWQFPIAPDVYYAAVDTTFAVYANVRHYCLRTSLRTGGSLQARHLPWYYDYDHLPEDEAYYIAHADRSSTTKEALQQRV